MNTVKSSAVRFYSRTTVVIQYVMETARDVNKREQTQLTQAKKKTDSEEKIRHCELESCIDIFLVQRQRLHRYPEPADHLAILTMRQIHDQAL